MKSHCENAAVYAIIIIIIIIIKLYLFKLGRSFVDLYKI